MAEGSGSAYSVVTGQGANISATAAAQVSSIIGEGATIFAPGVVSITANGTNIATSDAGSIGGAAFHVSAIFANATADGTDDAFLGSGVEFGNDTVVGTATDPDGGLVVSATGTDQSTAIVDLSGGGIFNGAGGNATATGRPTIDSEIFDGTSVDVTGDINNTGTSEIGGNASRRGLL